MKFNNYFKLGMLILGLGFVGCGETRPIQSENVTPVVVDGYQETPSGLKYKVIKEGTGEKPVATDRVRTHYEGKLLSGVIFDSSYQRGEPTEFGVNQVILGWQECLQMMNEGAVYEIIVPSELAYGERGAGRVIGPNETLHFKVELVKIIK